jgi:hypothetical protein
MFLRPKKPAYKGLKNPWLSRYREAEIEMEPIANQAIKMAGYKVIETVTHGFVSIVKITGPDGEASKLAHKLCMEAGWKARLKFDEDKHKSFSVFMKAHMLETLNLKLCIKYLESLESADKNKNQKEEKWRKDMLNDLNKLLKRNLKHKLIVPF